MGLATEIPVLHKTKKDYGRGMIIMDFPMMNQKQVTMKDDKGEIVKDDNGLELKQIVNVPAVQVGVVWENVQTPAMCFHSPNELEHQVDFDSWNQEDDPEITTTDDNDLDLEEVEVLPPADAEIPAELKTNEDQATT